MRKALVRVYPNGTKSIGFVGEDDIIRDFSGMQFIDASGKFNYGDKEIIAKDKIDFERAIKEQLQ